MIIISRGIRYKYEDYHKEIDGILYKKCASHEELFGNEMWFPCVSEHFYKNNKNGQDGLSPRCKKCEKKAARIWAVTNPEKKRESCRKNSYTPNIREFHRKNSQKQRDSGYRKQYEQDNPEKFKCYNQNHRVHDITKTEKIALLKIFENRCAYCGITLEEHLQKHHERLHDEHVDDDGYNDLRNDIPACKTCNSSKGTENMETWYRRQSFFTDERLAKILWWITDGYKNYIEDKPPYRITRKQNNDKKTYHWELWSVDERRDFIDCIAISNKKKNLKNDIKQYLEYINNKIS